MTIDPTSSCHTARQKSTTVFDSGPVERGEGGGGRGERERGKEEKEKCHVTAREGQKSVSESIGGNFF